MRELATRAGLPPATADGYVRGKHLPSPAQIGPFCSLLVACGITDKRELAAWQEALARIRASSDGRVGESRGRQRGEGTINPYRGLRPFEAGDASLFFGRAAFIDEILGRLARLQDSTQDGPRLLFIVGASGSGKSSVLRAGVVPAVARGGLGGGDRWRSLVMVPGADPLGALDNALAAAQSPAAPGGMHRLLIIDQFEDLYTYIGDEAERKRFVGALAALGPDTLIVVGLRADFLDRVAGDATLAPSLEEWRLAVPPLSEVELRAAIAQPAKAYGVTVEDALVELVLADMLPARRPGAIADHSALPLLSHALFAAWEHHTHSRLTAADLRAAGGLRGAVQQSAEQVYQESSLADRERARRMFLRMVNLYEGTIATRRGIAREALCATEPGLDAKMDELLDRFVAKRLVAVGEQHIEISHDALLIAWPRLAGWIAADHTGRRTNRQPTSPANGRQSCCLDNNVPMRGSVLTGIETSAGDTDNRAALDRRHLAGSVQVRAAGRDGVRQEIGPRRWLAAAIAVLLLVAAAAIGHTLDAMNDARQRWAASTSPSMPGTGHVVPAVPTATPRPPAPAASKAPSPAPYVARSAMSQTASPKATTRAKTPPGQAKSHSGPHQTGQTQHAQR